jgi:hypothetical protein
VSEAFHCHGKMEGGHSLTVRVEFVERSRQGFENFD